ncbi:MAG: sugar-binding protein [Actinomycetota bacterium]
MKNKYKKYVFFLDRFPYIVFLLVIGLSILFFISINNRLDLGFFSGQPPLEETVESYDVFISSPADGETFDMVNQNETVPVEIKALQIEGEDYEVNVLVNDELVETFTSPPYEFNWNPGQAGEYRIVAKVLDRQEQVIATSNQVVIVVNYQQTSEEEKIINEDIEAKKARVLEEKRYRSQNDASDKPIFSYRCYTPPNIDASIEEWDIYEKFSNFVPTIKKENYTSHTDVSGTFYSCWDQDNFYFAIQVVDDVFSQNYTGNQLNNGDSVVIVLDTDLEEDYNIQFLNSDDYQIEFSPGNFSDISPEAFMRWPTNAPPRDTVIRSSRLSNGYLIEASIPWDNFSNYNPQDEDILGFTVSILDTDHLQSTELVISSSKEFDFNNVLTLGNMVLIDAGDLIEEQPET